MTIAITGSAGATFAVDCTLMTQAGSRPLKFEGSVPEIFELRGTAVSCRIRQTGAAGSLVVELRRNGMTVSRSSMTGVAASLSIALR